MSLSDMLASLEAELSELNGQNELLLNILSKLNNASVKTDEIKKTSLQVLAINEKPFKEGIVDNVKSNIGRAADYISSTALPMINKKIEEVENSIEDVKQRIKEEEENQ